MTEYETEILQMINENNGTDIYMALECERSLKLHGGPYSQLVIDTCDRWISEHTLNKIAPTVMICA